MVEHSNNTCIRYFEKYSIQNKILQGRKISKHIADITIGFANWDQEILDNFYTQLNEQTQGKSQTS
jgi:hypothetical protein